MCLSGLTTIFPRALADQDHPIYGDAADSEKGCGGEQRPFHHLLGTRFLLFSIPFALLKIFKIDPLDGRQSSGDTGNITFTLAVRAGLGAYGYVLLAFGVFNLVLFPWYYKNPAKVNWPPVLSVSSSPVWWWALASGPNVASISTMGRRPRILSYWLYRSLSALAWGFYPLFFSVASRLKKPRKTSKKSICKIGNLQYRYFFTESVAFPNSLLLH
jgi:hypothetical protein